MTFIIYKCSEKNYNNKKNYYIKKTIIVKFGKRKVYILLLIIYSNEKN